MAVQLVSAPTIAVNPELVNLTCSFRPARKRVLRRGRCCSHSRPLVSCLINSNLHGATREAYICSYNAYAWDFSLQTGAKVVTVPVGSMDEGFEPDSIEVYKRTVAELREQGTKPRVLVSPYFYSAFQLCLYRICLVRKVRVDTDQCVGHHQPP